MRIEACISSTIESVKKAIREYKIHHPQNRVTNADLGPEPPNRLTHADLGDTGRDDKPLNVSHPHGKPS